ncbi:MAG: hypothetical protein WBV94_25370 [Blastocatellia bacterium]
MSEEKEQTGSADPDQKEAKPVGASHGEDTSVEGETAGEGRNIRTRGSGLSETARTHPSRSLEPRSAGYGIGGGYERPYRKEKAKPADSKSMYGPLPHAGYYGSGSGSRPFERGEAGFTDELSWYRSQYGEKTSGYQKKK